jgi:hypothetical protein
MALSCGKERVKVASDILRTQELNVKNETAYRVYGEPG